MADPVGGGLGKAAQQMMQQVQQQAQQQTQKPGGTQSGMEGKFDNMMAQKTQGMQDPTKVQDVTKMNEATKAMDVLKTAKANQVDPSLQVKTVEAVKDPQKMDGMKRVLSNVMDGQNALDSIIKKAASGKQFSNQELLAMQAGVYKFSQELELTSKVVEKATSGVKQTMQTQV
jgi:peptidoglycan hydrolase-like protein with peptidoglycan-binding domain